MCHDIWNNWEETSDDDGDFYDAKYWIPETDYSSPERYNLIKENNTSLTKRYEKVKRTFFRIINQSEISAFDYQKLIGLRQEGTSLVEWAKKNHLEISSTETPEDWFKEFLKDKEKKHNSLTGKIINKTNETLHLALHARNTENYQNRLFYFEVPANSEKYFSIPKASELKESYFGVESNRHAGKPHMFIGPNQFKGDYGFNEYINYLFNNYSFEMVFDENTKNLLWDKPNHDYWTLVPRYETEENVLTKSLDYKEAMKLLQKYN